MPHPADVQSNLELQFSRMDTMYANDELRVFGNKKKTLKELPYTQN